VRFNLSPYLDKLTVGKWAICFKKYFVQYLKPSVAQCHMLPEAELSSLVIVKEMLTGTAVRVQQ
jgi:hypothetical protein